MYFWNTKALSEDIKNSKISDNDWKNYYLAESIMITLSLYITMLTPSSRENVTSILIEAILMIGILIFGVSVTFNTHKTSGNNVASYISKMTALSFPLTIKFFVLYFAVSIVIAIAEAAGLSSEFSQTWLFVLLSVSFQTLWFWRLNIHLQTINK
jgi:ABC-type arginine/histidine transport system permease subunit